MPYPDSIARFELLAGSYRAMLCSPRLSLGVNDPPVVRERMRYGKRGAGNGTSKGFGQGAVGHARNQPGWP